MRVCRLSYAYVYVGEFVCEYIALSKIFTLPFFAYPTPASKAAPLAQSLPHRRSYAQYLFTHIYSISVPNEIFH